MLKKKKKRKKTGDQSQAETDPQMIQTLELLNRDIKITIFKKREKNNFSRY